MKQRKRSLSTRSLAEAWWAPVIDAERVQAWAATRERVNAAIQRVRFQSGYEDADVSALGDHLYSAADRTAVRRAS